ncbi:hypothetical protein F5Y15DRAFT_399763 [Xylariaceae sp. FL0016]|nr:hypothetical protein F5Y15DRAFT_399763 [Xylariaceae sp. FL0016]
MSPTQPSLFPQGGWDCHHHIFEPDTFPYHPDRHLTPPPATIAQYHAFRSRLGITHSVLTQGLSYGDDNASLRAFIPRLGPRATIAAIAVIDPAPHQTRDHDLRALHDAGVRGIRVNLYRFGAMDDAQRTRELLLSHARRVAPLGGCWSLTLTTAHAGFWDVLAPAVARVAREDGVRVVTDHFALLKGASMLGATETGHGGHVATQPGFSAVMRLVREGHLWVKLSAPYRVSEQGPDYGDVEVLVRALVEANRERVVWGSDWPHTPRMKVRTREEAMREAAYLEVDDERWLRSLRSWLSDEEWDLLMVRNPSQLFGR